MKRPLYITRRITAFILVFIYMLLSASCAPLEYTDGVEVDRAYPDEIIPLYEDAIVYQYKNLFDKKYEINAGTEDDFDDVVDFYLDYFEDGNITLEKESDRLSKYQGEGNINGYDFEVIITLPEGKWEEKLYETEIEIIIENDGSGVSTSGQPVEFSTSSVNISNNQIAKDILAQMKEDIIIIGDLVADAQSDDELPIEQTLEMFDRYNVDLTDKIDEIKTRVPNEAQLVQLQNSEIALFEISAGICEELVMIINYAFALLDAAEDLDYNIENGQDSTDAQIYNTINSSMTELIDALDVIETPSFMQHRHTELIDKLTEFTSMAADMIWSASIEDNLRISNYNYFLNYYLEYLDDFVVFVSDDLDIRIDKFNNDIDYINAWSNELEYFINNSLNTNTLDLVQYDEDYLAQGQEVVVSYVVEALDEVVPANYRSMDYLVFLQLWTNRESTDVMVTVRIPDYTQKYQEKITVTQAETELAILPTLVADISEKLNSSKDAQIEITVEDLSTGKIILKESEPVKLNSIYDMRWESMDGRLYYENILAWVTPESDMILTLLRNAGDTANDISDGWINGIYGYQGASTPEEQLDVTYYQTAAIMHAMADTMEVKYINAAFSSTDYGIQRVATPERVLENASGLCIETSVTLASALQSAGMNVMILILPTHAQVAVETWYGSGEYLLVETTALESAKNQDFDYVIGYFDKDEWADYIWQNDVVAIDCAMAVELGIYPID